MGHATMTLAKKFENITFFLSLKTTIYLLSKEITIVSNEM